MKITVFTPTYNRAHLLPRVKASLAAQNFNDFEWLLVDDGSTDNTAALVAAWQEENTTFPIRYYHKKNGGKHTTINKGLSVAAGTIFVLLDSDDQLVTNALSLIWSTYEEFKQHNIGGIIGLTSQEDGQLIGTEFPQHQMKVGFADLYYKWGVKGDKSVAFVTAVLQQYPFPEPEGIRFVSELTVWHPLSKAFPVIALNEVIEYKEYREGGLSNSSYQHWYWKSLAYTNYYLIQQDIHPWAEYPAVRKQEYIHLVLNALLSKQSYFWKLSQWKDRMHYLRALPRAVFSYVNIKRYVAKNNL